MLYQHGLPCSPEPIDEVNRNICFVVPGLRPNSIHRLVRIISLANLLANDGHRIDLAVWVPYRQPQGPVETWLALHCDQEIRINFIPTPKIPLAKGMLGLELYGAFNAYSWLKNQSFDTVYFHDEYGLGYHCLTAKKAGLEFHQQILTVIADTPSLMHLEANKSPVEDAGLLVRYEMERKCFELADQLLLFNKAVAQWMTREGIIFDPSKTAFEYPCFLPKATKNNPLPGDTYRQLVFWGDLSVRGGFPLFCAGIGRLPRAQIDRLQMKVYCRSPDSQSMAFAKQQFAQLNLDVSIAVDEQFSTIIDELQTSSSLVYSLDMSQQPTFEQIECLARGIPVVSLDCSANRDIYRTESQSLFLFEPRPAAIAESIENVVCDPVPAPLLSIDYADCREQWCRWHRNLGVESSPASTELQPAITVCLMHHERPQLVNQAIESIEAQTYPNIEVVLLDDGSTSTDAINELDRIEERFAAKGWRVVRQENKYLGAARNTAARHSGGEYLFFLDDDNFLRDDAIETLVRVAQHSQCDIVGSFSYSFTGVEKPDSNTRIRCLIAHMGSGLEFGLFKNPFADSNSLISKRFFDEMGGNTEDYGVGKDDQEFYARSLLNDANIIVVPEALYWARQLDSRLRHRHFNRYAGQWRVSQPYLDQIPANLRNIIRFSQAAFDQLYMEPVTLLSIARLMRSWIKTHVYAFAREILKYIRKLMS